ncbi:ATP synthase subunit I [Thiomonas sp. FB-Cd]|uniref:ATP synthase subunit I n=1 Tax=Thiomonas sp. FB-Cd TaxID=1158292 RepID=UPI0004DF2D2E|nr:ATP synthase subunit I [Thiomonas sp. FB-Cd]
MNFGAITMLSALPMPLALAAHGLAGVLLGVVYFRALWWNVQLMGHGGRTAAAIGLMIGRLALMIGALGLASRDGALPLLLMALGVLAGRAFVVRRLRRAPA